MNKKAKFNVSVDGVLFEQGKVYTAEQVAHIDESNFEDTNEEVSTPAGSEATEEKVETSTESGDENVEKKEEAVETKAVYKITNKETGEVLEVVPHTFGDGWDDFALASTPTEEWASPDLKLYRFANPNKDGNLTSEEWDIELIKVAPPAGSEALEG